MFISSLRRLRRRRGQFSLGGLACCCGGTTICVQVGCPSVFPLQGATIQLYTGSTLIDQCTTDSSGCCTLNDSGTYTVKVYNGTNLLSTTTQTLSGGTITITVSSSSSFLPHSVRITDSFTTITVPQFGTNYGVYSGGCYMLPTTSTRNACDCANNVAAAGGSIYVYYQVNFSFVSGCQVQIQRFWWYCGQLAGTMCGSYCTDTANLATCTIQTVACPTHPFANRCGGDSTSGANEDQVTVPFTGFPFSTTLVGGQFGSGIGCTILGSPYANQNVLLQT